MKITSSAFENGEKISSKYTCDGEDMNPPLRIEDIPSNTKSLCLIVEDPDAPGGTFVHWLLWNISPDGLKIEEGKAPEEAIKGRNDFDKRGWGGPCPPSGSHRYFFRVYALKDVLDLSPSSEKKELMQAMEGHIEDKAEIMGVYEKE